MLPGFRGARGSLPEGWDDLWLLVPALVPLGTHSSQKPLPKATLASRSRKLDTIAWTNAGRILIQARLLPPSLVLGLALARKT